MSMRKSEHTLCAQVKRGAKEAQRETTWFLSSSMRQEHNENLCQLRAVQIAIVRRSSCMTPLAAVTLK